MSSSSPLGDVFDRGSRSHTNYAYCVIGLRSLPVTGSSGLFFHCFYTVDLFDCGHWQTYVSGTLCFGKINVTMIGIHLISSVSPEFWLAKLRYLACDVRVLSPSISLALVSPSENIFVEHDSLLVIAFILEAPKITNKLVIVHINDMPKLIWNIWIGLSWGPCLLFLNQYFNCIVPDI
uniref:Uncharacterized protein n=1 Tax=Glossina palpalis gambiensis TaxID=67801 RepID=A0A1B0ATX0_9MUSC